MQETQMISFQEHGDSRGNLIALEGEKEIPFHIQRIFYIYGMDKTAVRGQHANRKSNFVMICLKGTAKIKVDDGRKSQTFVLEKPDQGLFIPKETWKEMSDFSADSVLLVLSDETYDAGEYIRDYQEFVKEVTDL